MALSGAVGTQVRKARALSEAAKLAPRLNPRRFTLETVGDACQAIRDGSARGKRVVDIVLPAQPGTN